MVSQKIITEVSSLYFGLIMDTAQYFFGADRRTYHSHQQCWRCSRETSHRSLSRRCSTVCYIPISITLTSQAVFQNIRGKHFLSFLDPKGVPSCDVEKENWSYCKYSSNAMFLSLVNLILLRYPCHPHLVWLVLHRWVGMG